MTSSTAVLTSNDNFVLSAVFGAESSSAKSVHGSLVNSLLPNKLPYTSSSLLPSLQDAERSIVLPLNTANPSTALTEVALSKINSLVSSNPNYASAYNNRAQILRLLHGDDLFKTPTKIRKMWNDLNQAIRLATPESGADRKVCALQAKVLAAAHMQRGSLLLKIVRNLDDLENADEVLPKEIKGFARRDIEELASMEFDLAWRYGDREAGEIAKSLNPYAKLCGSIVREAMKAELEKAEAA